MTKLTVPASRVAGDEELTRGHKKKARTRQQLIEAALRIYACKGVGEMALNELAEEAGVSNGTVYNYFRTREEVLDAVGIALADQLSHQVVEASIGITQGVERMAIGIRRFILQSTQDPQWASALISVARYAEGMLSALANYVRGDLQLGLRQGDFRYAHEEVALGVVLSATMGAMTAIVNGMKIDNHDSLIAEMILMALGVDVGKARSIATMPMPQERMAENL
jgi:AcrR family transcriptional regulator